MLIGRKDKEECNDALEREQLGKTEEELYKMKLDMNRCKDMRFMELGSHDLNQADGHFIVEAAKRAKTKVLQRDVLYMHQ